MFCDKQFDGRTDRVFRNIESWKSIYLARFARGSKSDLHELYADSYSWFGSIGSCFSLTAPMSKPTLYTFPESLIEAMPDLSITHHMFGEGNMVANHFIIQGTHTGFYKGIPPSGRPVQFFGNAIGRFDKKGRLIEEHELIDEISLLRQIEYVNDKTSGSLVEILENQKSRRQSTKGQFASLLPTKDILFSAADGNSDLRDSTVQANINNWERYTDKKYLNQDLDTLEEVMSPLYHYRGAMGVEFDMSNPQQAKEVLSLYRLALEVFPDLHFTSHYFGEGNMIARHVVCEGTHSSELLGVPATGQTIRYMNLSLSQFDEKNRLIDEREIIDWLAMHKQMGVIPDPFKTFSYLDLFQGLDCH